MIHFSIKRSFFAAITIVLLNGCGSPGQLQPWLGYPRLQQTKTVRTWLVLKCTFSDDRTTRFLPTGLSPAISSLDDYINKFLTTAGAGTGNVIDYYRDVTYGSLSLSSRVYGWFDAPYPKANTLNRPARVEQCANAIPASQASGMDFGSYWGIIMVTNAPADGGACGDGQLPLQIQGQVYNLGCVVFDANSMYTAFAAHEVGHGLGFHHSWDNSPCEYCDQFDVMSAFNTWEFYLPNYPPYGAFTSHRNGIQSGGAGPGLNLPNLLFLNAIPASRIATYHIGDPQKQFVLTALSHPIGNAYLGLEIVGSDQNDVYTVEYRQADGWDQGFPLNGVLIHEYRIGSNPYSYLESGPTVPGGGSSGFWTPSTEWDSKTSKASVFVSYFTAPSATANVWVFTR
jgi:hypothetical protein